MTVAQCDPVFRVSSVLNYLSLSVHPWVQYSDTEYVAGSISSALDEDAGINYCV